jgi:hypothetical protein
LYLLVNSRYEDERAIVFTSDVSAEEVDQDAAVTHDQDQSGGSLAKHIGPRIASRLLEMCGDPVPITGTDKRRDLMLNFDSGERSWQRSGAR